MNWEKEGLIFKPNRIYYWQNSHAALPTALFLKDDTYRIYFTSRDQQNRTFVGYFDWDVVTNKITNQSSEYPLLAPGPLGHFDDHGVQATSVVRNNDMVYMYYLGWNPALTKPLFYTAIGLAISTDGGQTFEKYSPAPIMSRGQHDPWMVSGGTVIKENDLWRMWYLSGIDFTIEDEEAISRYNIKYAESKDGIDWIREGFTSLPLKGGETNISRMSILKIDGEYKAWYPVKKRETSGYRLGFAKSADGLQWDRQDHLVGITVSGEGWDSIALDKQEVIFHKGRYYMLYNGNSFGKDGIGLAISEG
ncbi:glycoside hydrolase family protein [Roseivirga misakiensis]|uniref:Glycosyl hydrolase family 32 N-terminal domain-containing protein n=1 Tax=Roseivirga misakiensis TaxID=1563681 RepID=A0A1E5T1H2_9BACT|nr:hypothetical protein [Roseivirga misakiensis]OEK05220.1 hypothetical protein BFP71_17610 [Roseivirga misakiensis]